MKAIAYDALTGKRLNLDAKSLQPREPNKLESAYGRRLDTLERLGEIASWSFESHKLRLADGAWYTPDFEVVMPDGSVEFHEVKGFMREDARLKLVGIAEAFPHYVFRLVRFRDREWNMIEVISRARRIKLSKMKM